MNKQAVIAVVVALSSIACAIAEEAGHGNTRTQDARIAREGAREICDSLVHSSSRTAAPVELIDELTRALDIDDYGVRYFAIRSLALIGKPAAGALPSLRRLLDVQRAPPKGALMAGDTLVSQIENAIAVIEGRTTSLEPAVSDECTNPGVIE